MKLITKSFLFIFSLFFISFNSFASKTYVQLPHTDGKNLAAQLAPLTPEQRKKLNKLSKNHCTEKCVTPFGTRLGIANGVIGYSNCRSVCVKPLYSFMNLENNQIKNLSENPENKNWHYIGVVYQCVEFARKWWMKNLGITFGSIDSAYQILYLQEGEYIKTGKHFPLARSINGSATIAPKIGDLLIYAPDRQRPNWVHGHVAVIVAVDEKNGSLSVAEENYDNKPWQNPSAFSRKISFFKKGDYYSVLDVTPGQPDHHTGGIISGWIYPYHTSKRSSK